MTTDTYQHILNLITMPSQYLGTEINAVKKDPDKVKLKIALAFPDLYEIGMSHFGIQILYAILNQQPEIAAERIFCPAVDMEYHLRKNNIPLLSLESGTPLKKFDIVGFSLLYELNYTNILTILELSQIPFLARQRDESNPFIIAGGPCACNSEPVAGFFDAIVFGDGEEVCLKMAQIFLENKKEGFFKKDNILHQWSRIQGVYIPSFFEERKITIETSDIIIPQPLYENYKTIKKAIVTDLNQADFPENPIVPFGKPVHDRLRVEISRGCSRGCRFCQAGMIYRPVRERHCHHIARLLKNCIHSTGYDDISLLSLSSGDYTGIENLLEHLMGTYCGRHIAVSLPSLRAGTLTSSLMKLIKKVRKTGFTIAPEAGSQRLRNVINKNITDEQVIKTVHDAVTLGWKTIKLYFMIGLPTETEEDLRETIHFIKKIMNMKGLKKSHFSINASFTTFIPKPHTPFQWAGQVNLQYSKEVLSRFQKEFRGKRVRIKWQQPETSRIEGLFARGDRSLTDLVIHSFKKGCRLDGWSDHFKYDQWVESAQSLGIDMDFYTTRKRSVSEQLAWDHMDCRVNKNYFLEEWSRAAKEMPTMDCKSGKCHQCGICNFQNIQPVFNASNLLMEKKSDDVLSVEEPQKKTMMVVYSKMGIAKYFGHLELVNIFLRAIRRADIPVEFSKGFHPMPRISFEDPLPLGMESEEERFFIDLSKNIEPEKVLQQLNTLLPESIKVMTCIIFEKNFKKPIIKEIIYTIESEKEIFKEKALENFMNCLEFNLIRINKKGKTKTVNLKNIIETIRILEKNKLLLKTSFVPGNNLRPLEIVKNIFGLSEENLYQARIVKRSVKRKDQDVQTIDYK